MRSSPLESPVYFFQWQDGVVTFQEQGPTDDQIKLVCLSIFYYDCESWKLYQVVDVDDLRPYCASFIVPASSFEYGLPPIRLGHIGDTDIEIPNVFAAMRRPPKVKVRLATSVYEARPATEWASG